MPRTAQANVGNMYYHVTNRGNGRAEIFHKDRDYLRFTEMVSEAESVWCVFVFLQRWRT